VAGEAVAEVRHGATYFLSMRLVMFSAMVHVGYLCEHALAT